MMLTVLKYKGLLCSTEMFYFTKAFPHSFTPHSFSPHSFKTHYHFVAPGPCKIGFLSYQRAKQFFFFLAHAEVLENYLLTMKNTCFKLRDW